ncbi:MAG: response regulator SirA [Gammaproteobacteria bacterium]|nr:MAG: response regulator SirA [Gammaproteobacteria bacterium]
MAEVSKKLDVRGLNCPQPILRTRASLEEMKSGKVLQVIATDPGSIRDVKTFCRQTDHTLLSSSELEGEYIFLIQKG